MIGSISELMTGAVSIVTPEITTPDTRAPVVASTAVRRMVFPDARVKNSGRLTICGAAIRGLRLAYPCHIQESHVAICEP